MCTLAGALRALSRRDQLDRAPCRLCSRHRATTNFTAYTSGEMEVNLISLQSAGGCDSYVPDTLSGQLWEALMKFNEEDDFRASLLGRESHYTLSICALTKSFRYQAQGLKKKRRRIFLKSFPLASKEREIPTFSIFHAEPNSAQLSFS